MTPLADSARPTPVLTKMRAAAGAALALCVLALCHGLHSDVGPLPIIERVPAAPAALLCQSQRGDRGSVVHLRNGTGAELPRGARIAWVTTGTPAAQGQWLWLAQPLAPGQGLAIPLSTALYGSGCIAKLLD